MCVHRRGSKEHLSSLGWDWVAAFSHICARVFVVLAYWCCGAGKLPAGLYLLKQLCWSYSIGVAVIGREFIIWRAWQCL